MGKIIAFLLCAGLALAQYTPPPGGTQVLTGYVQGAGSLVTNNAVTCGNGSGSVLDCTSSATIPGLANAGVYLAAVGSQALPAYSITGHTSSGMYWDGAGSLA